MIRGKVNNARVYVRGARERVQKVKRTDSGHDKGLKRGRLKRPVTRSHSASERIYCYVPVKYDNSRNMADISNDYHLRHWSLSDPVYRNFYRLLRATLTRRE